MNSRQKITLSIYIAAVLTIVVYPAFNIEVRGIIIKSEYSWLWEPINQSNNNVYGSIDVPRLLVQLIGVNLVAGAALLLFKKRND